MTRKRVRQPRRNRLVQFESTEMPTIHNFVDLTGRRFGRLVVTAFGGKRRGRCYWVCACDCGEATHVQSDDLNSSHTRSCGCLQAEVTTKRNFASVKHGHCPKARPSPEYTTWNAMKMRCTNPRNIKWPLYGGRGIKVCDRWMGSFEAFLADMGPRPSRRHSIDRIDGDKNYEPGNCRWATPLEQRHNRRRAA